MDVLHENVNKREMKNLQDLKMVQEDFFEFVIKKEFIYMTEKPEKVSKKLTALKEKHEKSVKKDCNYLKNLAFKYEANLYLLKNLIKNRTFTSLFPNDTEKIKWSLELIYSKYIDLMEFDLDSKAHKYLNRTINIGKCIKKSRGKVKFDAMSDDESNESDEEDEIEIPYKVLICITKKAEAELRNGYKKDTNSVNYDFNKLVSKIKWSFIKCNGNVEKNNGNEIDLKEKIMEETDLKNLINLIKEFYDTTYEKNCKRVYQMTGDGILDKLKFKTSLHFKGIKKFFESAAKKLCNFVLISIAAYSFIFSAIYGIAMCSKKPEIGVVFFAGYFTCGLIFAELFTFLKFAWIYSQKRMKRFMMKNNKKVAKRKKKQMIY